MAPQVVASLRLADGSCSKADTSGSVVNCGVDPAVVVEPSIGGSLAETNWKFKVQSGKAVCFPDERLWADDGLVRLKVPERSFA